jgi:hypothetical protein
MEKTEAAAQEVETQKRKAETEAGEPEDTPTKKQKTEASIR